MKIEKIDIVTEKFTPISKIEPDGLVHIKALPFLSAVQPLEGSYGIKLDNSIEMTAEEGGFFIAPAAVLQTITHRFSKEKNRMTARWLFLDARINGKYALDEIYSFPAVIPKKRGEKLSGLFDGLAAAWDYCSRMSAIYGIIGELISISESEKSPEQNGIAKSVRLINSDYAAPLTVKTLADAAAMSESNYYAVFRKRFGCSPIDYINRLRLSVAADMLAADDAPVGEIALAVGINDPFYFSKMFKKSFGISPREYRKSRKNM